MNNNNEYKYPMCKMDYSTMKVSEIVMCRRLKDADYNHYGTEWYAYEDKDGNIYYGR